MASSVHSADHGHPKDTWLASSRSVAPWAILFLLLIVEIYGFVRTGIFGQQMWSPAGILRMVWFAIGYGALAGVTLKWRPGLYVPVLATVVLSWTCLAVGILPLLAVGLFLLASWQLGKLVLFPKGPSLPGDKRVDHVLALLLGTAVYSFLQGLLVHIPINTSVSALLLLSLPLIIRPGQTKTSLLEIRSAVRDLAGGDRGTQGALAWMGFPAVACWLVALKPEVSSDGLAMHLAIPSFVANHHYWSFDFQQTLWSLMPMGGDWCYTLVYLLGGEAAARLLNLAFVILIATLIFLICRRWLPTGGAATLTALFLTTPLVQLVTGSLFVENFWTVMVLGAFAGLMRTYESGRHGALHASGILLGVAISAKFGAIPFAVPLVIIGCWLVMRHFSYSVRKSIPVMFAYLCLLIVFAAQPYVTALLRTGNPVFPFLADIFPSPFFDSAWFLDDVRFERPVNLQFLYDLTFHTDQYLEGQAGAAGFQYLLLLPLCLVLLLRRRNNLAWMAFACGLLGSWLTFIQLTNLRYGYAAMPLLTIAFAAALGDYRKDHQGFYRSVMSICVIAAITNIYFSGASGGLHRDFWLNPFSDAERLNYLETYAPVRALVDHLNRAVPDEPVIFVGTNQIAGLKGKALTSTWHNKPIGRRLEMANSAEELLKIAHDFDVQYFISTVPEAGAPSLPMFGPFLTTFTEPEYRSGSFYIAKLKSDFTGEAGLMRAKGAHLGDSQKLASLEISPSSAPREPLGPGGHDDRDANLVYHGRWDHTKEYPKARGSSMSYSTVIGGAVEFSFVGQEMTYVYTRAYNRGKASVNIDGTDVAVIDQYSPGIDWQNTKTWSGFAPGIHHVLIRVLPERNPASEGFFIDVDAIDVR